MTIPPYGPAPWPVSPPPPPSPRREPACEHTTRDWVNQRILAARMPVFLTDKGTPHVCRVAGGDRELQLVKCPDCGTHIGYRFRRISEHVDEFIGADSEVVQAALASLLAQPDVEIFVIDLVGEGGRHVVPRHHLPAFNIVDR